MNATQSIIAEATTPSGVVASLSTKPDDATERRLAIDAAAGSMPAFEQIAMIYQAPLLRFLRRRMADSIDAEDVLQETFLCAFRKIGQYDPRWRISGWLFTIAVRQAATHRRRMRLTTALGGDEQIDPYPHPDDAAAERDSSANVWSVARRQLSTDQFNALWLYYVQGLDMPDLARALGRTRLTTKVLLHRARQRLKPHLASERWTDDRKGTP